MYACILPQNLLVEPLFETPPQDEDEVPPPVPPRKDPLLTLLPTPPIPLPPQNDLLLALFPTPPIPLPPQNDLLVTLFPTPPKDEVLLPVPPQNDLLLETSSPCVKVTKMNMELLEGSIYSSHFMDI